MIGFDWISNPCLEWCFVHRFDNWWIDNVDIKLWSSITNSHCLHLHRKRSNYWNDNHWEFHFFTVFLWSAHTVIGFKKHFIWSLLRIIWVKLFGPCYFSLNSKKFQNFHFLALIVILRKNHKHKNKGEFQDFYESPLYMISAIFLKILIPLYRVYS